MALSRQQRQYDRDYDRDVRDWERRLAAGERVLCWRCLEQGVTTVINGQDRSSWDLGHDDQDRTIIRGPECRGPNRATATRRWAAARRPREVHPMLRDP